VAGLAALAIGLLLYQWRSKTRKVSEEPLTVLNEARAYLIVHYGQNTRFLIKKSPVRIGRSPNNDLMLNDNSVSRHHAEITRNRDGVFSIKDLDSLNGVFVNDKRVKSAVLSEGCEIDIGDVRVTFTQHEFHPLPRVPK
jgi:pSer/pThr/pTyr-binding forkhead associated (FHA) protein